VLTADTDPTQVTYGVLGAPYGEAGKAWCTTLAGTSATCRPVRSGPAYLTDVESLGRDCVGQFVAVVSKNRAPRLVLGGPFRLHGARLFVEPDERLVVGQLEQPEAANIAPDIDTLDADSNEEIVPRVVLRETDPRYQCKLLWSGFEPYG
jgi:hypothetical protein